MNLEFVCDEVWVQDTGMGIHITFTKLNKEGDENFIIQKHFEDEGDYDGRSNIELSKYDEVLLGGFYEVEVELSRAKCIFTFGGNQLSFKFDIGNKKFEELKDNLKILASVKIQD